MNRAANVLLKPHRIALILLLAGLSTAWTCSAVVNLNGCPDATSHPQIGALSPNPISANVSEEVLSVDGMGFGPQSQILWNKYPLPITFIDSRHLQTTITQETYGTYGGSAGTTVLISVSSPGTGSAVGCTNGNSSTAILEID
jgi:hypothetical protein